MQVTSPGCRRGDTERPSDEMSGDLLALGKKQCRLAPATEMSVPCAGNVGSRRNCQCPALARQRLEIFSSSWLKLTDTKQASVRIVLARRQTLASSESTTDPVVA